MPTPPNFVLFIGRLHPILLHLPIGFLMLLALVEILGRFKSYRGALQARGIMLAATAGSAVVTILCGLMLSTSGSYDPSLISWHKWMGLSLGAAILTAAWAHWQHQPRLYTGALIASLLILAPASHFGGSITHGKNYLTAYAPLWMRPSAPIPQATALAQTALPRTVGQAVAYSDLVQPILIQNCAACHGTEKSSGRLRLDNYSALRSGGNDGPIVIDGNSADSLLLRRILLPMNDGRHMPPDGKPQLADEQVDVLKWWIDAGAPEHKTVAKLSPSEERLTEISQILKLPESVDAAAGNDPPPVSIADAQRRIAALSEQLKIVFTPYSVDQPWLIVNASMNHAFGDAELSQLASLSPNIVDLNLANTRVTDSALATVGGMISLTRLRLDRTAVTDAGIQQLSRLRKLTYLNLYGTGVTDKSLQTLSGMASLRQLYIWQTKIDPAAANAFAASKTNESKIAKLKKQIKALQEQVAASHVEVVQGMKPTTAPAAKQ